MLNHFNKKYYAYKELEPLLEQIAGYWGWSEIIDSYRRNELHGMEFMKECQITSRHPPCSVTACGANCLKMKRNN